MTHVFNQSRRTLLKSGAVALFAAASGPLPLFVERAAAHAVSAASATAARPKVLVTLFLRFGMDGLMAVTPYTDAHLAKLRPNLMLSAPGTGRENSRLELGDGFGLHPAMASMLPLYQSRELAIIHGVGSPHPTRSHGTAQLWWESGTPGDRSNSDGWLNKAAVALPAGAQSLLPAVALTEQRPRIFYGHHPVTNIRNLEQLSLQGESMEFLQQLEAQYRQQSNPVLRETASAGLELARVLSRQPAASAAYPAGSTLGASLRDIAQLIKADVGLQLAFADSNQSPDRKGTWDTHSNSAALGGPFGVMARDLADSLAAFRADLGDRWEDVTVVTLTDFGRTVLENKRVGTDHGRATAMLVLGGDVHGGNVLGQLPERFERDALEDRMDLPVTTDYRAVLGNLLQTRLGIADLGAVFPGWLGQPFRIA
jgi:uncharacterized protein (DUF1501 family)